MPYIGNQPAEQFTSFATQEFSTSATTSYTLDHAVTNENEIALFVNNVRQQPGSGKAYTATGTALTLSAATASTDTMYCVFLGRALQTVNPATNSITAAMVSNDLISGKTALGATPADTDEFLVSDAGTLKRVDYSHIKGGKVLQVVHGTDETSRETTSTSYASLTLNASITPSATSSKVLVLVSLAVSSAFDEKYGYFTLYRDSSDVGNSGGSGFFYTFDSDGSGDVYMAGSITHLDSPSTTSETTYTLYGKATSGGKARINTNGGRSTITLIEIGA